MIKKLDPIPNIRLLEEDLLKKWYENGIVTLYCRKNRNSNKRFSFLDGPITANNPMGVHHAWGRTYKDIWQRFYNLNGYKQRFQNGFDCQGLWVEVEVEKELKLKTKKEIENLVEGNKKASIEKFINLCKERVKKYSAIQTEQSKRLGYFMDWDNSYYTMSDENNYMIWHFLKVCYDNGWIYKGCETVPWCPRCETAISQHEILTEDYKETTHESITFSLPIIERKNEYLLVWTTTPWTIPANTAVAVDENFDYCLVENFDGKLYWLAKDLVVSVFNKKYKRIVKTVKGKELVGLHYRTVFDNLRKIKLIAKKNNNLHTVVPTDTAILPITLTEGTGMVHIAPSAGVEDFKLAKKLNLPMVLVIKDNADYMDDMDEFSGKNAKNSPSIILDFMLNYDKFDNSGVRWVFDIKPYTHRYPVCWRCKSELVWKVADEWYIAMDIPAKNDNFTFDTSNTNFKSKPLTLRERMMNVAKQIRWMPEFGKERELEWLSQMHDWLISKKNRYWGLALPIYECKCGYFEVIGSKEELKQKAVDGWELFEGHSPHKPWVDEVKIKCPKCNNKISRIADVGNPWLDAGIVPFSTITEDNKGKPLYLKDRSEWEKWFPADFITESFPGQFKNWFYALIAMSTVLENKPPFKTVLGYGTLLAEDGRPMHKSWGNSIEFYEGAEKMGVDVMRWIYSRANPFENLCFGYNRAEDVKKNFYLILWNCYRFFCEYSDKEDIEIDYVFSGEINVLDSWILSLFSSLVKEVEKELADYNCQKAATAIETFVDKHLSKWYIRRSRERVRGRSEDSKDIKAFCSTLYFILYNLAIILSPFMPFIADEIYSTLSGGESVHLASWPKNLYPIDKKLEKDMDFLRDIVEEGNRIRKIKNIKLRQPLLSMKLRIPKNIKPFLCSKYVEKYKDIIANELNVKKVIFEETSDSDISVIFDENITEELKKEGLIRELIRKIQRERKLLRLTQDDLISVTLPEELYYLVDESFKKRIQAYSIDKGPKFIVTKYDFKQKH